MEKQSNSMTRSAKQSLISIPNAFPRAPSLSVRTIVSIKKAMIQTQKFSFPLFTKMNCRTRTRYYESCSCLRFGDCVKEAIDHYHSGQQFDVNRDLSRLNSLYDNFIKDYGFLNVKKNITAFYDDPDSSLLQSLEIWNSKTKTATKAEIFDGITFFRKESPTLLNRLLML